MDGDSPAPPPEQLDAILRAWQTSARIGWSPFMYDPKLRERLYCVVAPTLMVWGAEDRIVPLEHGHAYQAGIEGLRLVTIEKSGHMPLVEQPQPTAHWMIDSSQLQLKIPLKEASLYLWGTGQARHCFCPKCTAAVLRNPRTTPRD